MDGDSVPLATKLLNPVFVDDYAIPILSKAARFFDKSKAALAVVADSFTEFGMSLNMKVGKTALQAL